MTDVGFVVDKRQVRRSFDRAAPTYDRHARLQKTVGGELLERLDGIPVDPRQILDLGSGTGQWTRALAARFPTTGVLGVDLSFGMIRQARSLRHRLFGRAQYAVADADHLPLGDGAADLVFSSLTLQWCNELPRTFAELRRVLAPGGLLLFSTFGADTLTELRQAWAAVDDRDHVNRFPHLLDVGDQLQGAGFKEVVMDADRHIHHYPDLAALMEALKRIGAHNVTAGRPQGLTGRGRLAAVTRAYEACRVSRGLPATYEVVYGHGWASDPPEVVAAALGPD